MTINEISQTKGTVTVTLTADELITLCNIMHNAPETSKNDKYYKLDADLVLARDLCQYGHIDNFSLSRVVDNRAQFSDIETELDRRRERRENKK